MRSSIRHLLLDKRGNASRPKLVFLSFFLDVSIVAGVGAVVSLTGQAEGAFTLGSLVKFLGVALFFGVLMKSQWGYTIANLLHPVRQFGKVMKAGIGAFGLTAGVGYLAQHGVMTPGVGLTWAVTATLLVMGGRLAFGLALRHLGRTGRLVRRTVIVGGGEDADALLGIFANDAAFQVKVLGVFDDRSRDRELQSGGTFAKLGNFSEMERFVRDEGVDLLVVTVPITAQERLLKILEQLMQLPVDIRVSAHRSRLRLNAKAYTYIGNVPMYALMDRPLTDWDRGMKNLEDRVLGALLLLLLSPVMALVALAVRLDSKGPIFFKQRRYGFNNELVQVYKFRSMYVEKSDATASKLVTRDDPRVTKVGRFIRRTSLDELPQLFNVLKGEMSLVGPRPHATEAKAQSDLYQSVVHGYFARHRVKPGVTGWAQINGWRGETDTHEKIQRRVEHDLYYIDNWSLAFDLYILAMTPVSLVVDRNAY
ncbi:MAG: undecaprenyl-phosphate glucose phosphotransferase [Hyphomicrobiaceae bacterium]